MGKKRKTEVFIDASNYHYALKKAGWMIDYKKFANYMKTQYDIVKTYYYEGIPSESQYIDRHPGATRMEFWEYKKEKKNYFTLLKKFGFHVRSKTVSRIFDIASNTYHYKCNFDVELTIDALNDMDNYEEFVLCSGDGDFKELIKYLKGKYKFTTVITFRDRVSHLLLRSANRVEYIGNLKPLIAM